MANKLRNNSNRVCTVILEKADLHKLQAKINAATSRNMHDETELKNAVSEKMPVYKHLIEDTNSNRVCTVILEKVDLHKVQAKINSATSRNMDVDSELKNAVSEKMPVYKHLIEDKSKENHDLYEFDEIDIDADGSKAKKNLKKRVRNATNHIKRKNKQAGKHDWMKKPKKFNTYAAKVQEILKKAIEKIDRGKSEETIVPTHTEVFKECNNINQPKDCTSQGNTRTTKRAEEIANIVAETSQYSTDNAWENIVRSETPESHFRLDTPLEAREILLNITNNTSVFSGSKNAEVLGNKSVRDANIETYFILDSPSKKKEKIQVISDITLNTSGEILFANEDDDDDDSDDEEFLDFSLQPNANSTVLAIQKSTPWRFTANVRRNPHYLYIKRNALPSLQQEIIITHDQVKRIEERVLKVPRKKRLKPAKEIESCDTNNKENIPYSSLFGSEETFTEITTVQEEGRPKRAILGVRDQNTVNTITNYITVGKKLEVRLLKELPKKTNVDNVNKNEVEKTDDKNVDKEDENMENQDKDSIDVDNNPKLFDDEDLTLNLNKNYEIYLPKVRRKRKLIPDNVEKPEKHHKKDVMTKAEEAELDKWAAQFNSLCEDIEKYNLEIE